MALFNREIYYKLPSNGNGIPGPNGKRVVLRGMNTYPPKPVSSQRMEAVLRQDDIEWSTKCLVAFRKHPNNKTQHPTDIQA